MLQSLRVLDSLSAEVQKSGLLRCVDPRPWAVPEERSADKERMSTCLQSALNCWTPWMLLEHFPE